LKAAIIKGMETYFGKDAKRIGHSHRVTRYAEQLLQQEGGDPTVVAAAAILHDIGIHSAARIYGSTEGKYQETEGPPIARQILANVGFPSDRTDEVCAIVGHHHSPGIITTTNFKIVYDADWLVSFGDEGLREKYHGRDEDRLPTIIDKLFLTEGGKKLARRIYLEDKR
jgi:HD superfamily phosphodiesterase